MKAILFTIFAMSLSCIEASAQNSVAIWQKDGTVARFAFDEKPVVTYSGNDLVLTTKKTSVSYPIYLLQKLMFDIDWSEPTGIDNVKTEPEMQYRFESGVLIVKGGEPLSQLTIYSLKGIMMGQYRLDNEGCANIPLHRFGRGIYIVKTKRFTFKFQLP